MSSNHHVNASRDHLTMSLASSSTSEEGNYYDAIGGPPCTDEDDANDSREIPVLRYEELVDIIISPTFEIISYWILSEIEAYMLQKNRPVFTFYAGKCHMTSRVSNVRQKYLYLSFRNGLKIEK
jgi:hypothetical protein